MGRGHDSTSVGESEELSVDSAVSEDFDVDLEPEGLSGLPLKLTDEKGQAGLPAAFELIAEACAAVKIAEERATLAEGALEDVARHFSGQIEELTDRLDVAHRRAEMAERQAAQAEERLRIFCQTILTTMHNTET